MEKERKEFSDEKGIAIVKIENIVTVFKCLLSL